MQLKIATLNWCLGIKNNKELVGQLLLDNQIDVLCMQEIEIEKNYPSGILNLPNYVLEVKENSVKSRVGIYIKNKVKYLRQFEMEGVDSHLMIVDIKAKTSIRLINIYRWFNPQEGISAKAKFLIQLDLISKAAVPNTFIVGDFNIDYKRRFDVEYCLIDLLNCMEEKLGEKT